VRGIYAQRIDRTYPKSETRQGRLQPVGRSVFSRPLQLPKHIEKRDDRPRDLTAFFLKFGIRSPRQITYEKACAFVPWRITGGKDGKDIPPVSVNTAWERFMFLRVLMAEAVHRGFCEFNVTRDVKTKRQPSAQKNEITVEDEAIIEAKLKKKPEWMRESWLILMRQGCRVTETPVPMERVDTDAMTITFRIKGGRLHTASLHPDLLPLVAKARKQVRPTLIVPPKSFGCCWNVFFIRAALPYSIHCTRVTVITRLIRAGHPVAMVSNFVGHTQEVDRIYQKLKPADSLGLLQTLSSKAQGSGSE